MILIEKNDYFYKKYLYSVMGIEEDDI